MEFQWNKFLNICLLVLLTSLSTGCVNPNYSPYAHEPYKQYTLSDAPLTHQPDPVVKHDQKVVVPSVEARKNIMGFREKRLCEEGKRYINNILYTDNKDMLIYDLSTVSTAMEIMVCAGDEQGFNKIANVTAHNDQLINAMKEAARVNFTVLHDLYVCIYRSDRYDTQNCMPQVQYLRNSIGGLADVWMPLG